MDENLLDNQTTSSGIDELLSEVVESDSGSGADSSFSPDSVSGGDVSLSSPNTTVIYNMEYDETLGGYPVVIVNDISEDYGVSTFALPSSSPGYQLSDYWINYFRGVLQKYPGKDYLAFSTREYYDSGNSYNNYINHYWLYLGDIENGGSVTVYNCYSVSSVYYVDISTELISAINVDDYDTLVYSNLGSVSDLREGGGYGGQLALLFTLAFFAVYVVCRDFFKSCIRKRH